MVPEDLLSHMARPHDEDDAPMLAIRRMSEAPVIPWPRTTPIHIGKRSLWAGPSFVFPPSLSAMQAPPVKGGGRWWKCLCSPKLVTIREQFSEWLDRIVTRDAGQVVLPLGEEDWRQVLETIREAHWAAARLLIEHLPTFPTLRYHLFLSLIPLVPGPNDLVHTQASPPHSVRIYT